MGIAGTFREYLNDRGIHYEVVAHEPTLTSLQTAHASHVPQEHLAKGVVLTREGGFVLAVLPASCRVRLDAIEQLVGCPIGMATEAEIGSLFPDCAAGAVPPIGAAYAVDCIVDESLEDAADIYLEGGDHCSLVRVSHAQFHDLMKDVPHANIAMHG